ALPVSLPTAVRAGAALRPHWLSRCGRSAVATRKRRADHAEPSAAPDCGGITAFQGSLSHRLPRQGDSAFSGVPMKSQLMYIERKDGLTGPARIGWVAFSQTGRTLYYAGHSFRSLKGVGYKATTLMSKAANGIGYAAPARTAWIRCTPRRLRSTPMPGRNTGSMYEVSLSPYNGRHLTLPASTVGESHNRSLLCMGPLATAAVEVGSVEREACRTKRYRYSVSPAAAAASMMPGRSSRGNRLFLRPCVPGRHPGQGCGRSGLVPGFYPSLGRVA